MITPKDINLEIFQGASYLKGWEIVDKNGDPIDLSGWSARCHFRLKVNDAAIILDSSTENGRMFIDQTPEYTRYGFDLSPEDTRGLTAKAYVYDVKLIDPTGAVARVQQGRVSVDPAVTRSWQQQ